MKYKGKKRKTKNPLIWANWKLREQLHAAKEEISELETKKSEFFTVSFAFRNRQGFIDFNFIKSFHTYSEALAIFDFVVYSFGTHNGEIRVLIDDCKNRTVKDYYTDNFFGKKGSEVSNA
jgi:hypothetical protein